MAKSTSVKISCDEMIQKVVDTFIVGADQKFLKKVEKAAKGGGFMNDIGNALSTKDKKYSFIVFAPLFFFMKSKSVFFLDKENNVEYEMPKKEWPKFYQAIKDAVAKEMAK